MEKIMTEDKIKFYDGEKEILSLGFIADEFILTINTDGIIEINENEELYEYLNDIFMQNYDFGENFLNDNKTEQELIWHSDGYYNPDDIWSIKALNCLHITFNGEKYNMWCENEIDKQFNRKRSQYYISFSPAGNGKYAKNTNTGCSLQDDFVVDLYQKLFQKKSVKKLSK